MKEVSEDIVRLVLKSLEKGLTADEQKYLDEWLQAHPGMEEEIQQLKRYAATGRDIRKFRQIKLEEAWKRVDQQTGKMPVSKRGRMIPYWWGAAAVVVFIFAGIFLLNRPQEPANTMLATRDMADFKPGSQKATWELPTGKFIELEKDSERLLMGEDGTVLGRDSANVLVVNKRGKGEVEHSTVSVPQGGEYGIVLADGTKVWMNSDSELRFPSAFEGKERVVELKGEAYFDVAKDTRHPFVVKTGKSAICVLGTSFNICGYAGDEYQQTTLVSGSVEVDYKGKQYRLIPGEQLEVRANGEQPEIKKVDVRLYTSWKDGMFRFLDMPLDQLTAKLTRWYDVNFTFENETCKAYRFSGAVRKDVNFKEFIRLVESTTDVKFEINGDNIVIKEK